MTVRVMLINAIDSSKPDSEITPPLGLGYLVSSLRQRFGRGSFCFKYACRRIDDELNSFDPHVVGITSVSQNFNTAKAHAARVKHFNEDIPVLIGGVHVSLLPATITQEMDVGIVGEGEQTVCELFEGFLDSGGFHDLESVPGLAFRKDGEVHQTEARQLIEPLDSIPVPDRDIFPIDPELSIGLMASRGCPYNCVFCSSTRFFRKLRMFSADYVVKEIQTLIQAYGAKKIGFEDDLFILDRARLESISRQVVEQGINKEVEFTCHARANLVNDDTTRLLRDMNVKIVQMGLESGCPTTLRYLKGKSVTVEDNQRAIDTIHRYKMEAFGSFIFGSPYETKEDVLETLRFIEKSGIDYFWSYLLTPLPGTPIWDFAKEKGLIENEGDFDWDSLRFDFMENYNKAIVLSQTLTREELYELCQQFYEVFRKVKFKHRVKTALKNPKTIYRYIANKIPANLRHVLQTEKERYV